MLAGFTLVELVVVIVIVGILAAVAAPTFLDRAAGATAAAEISNVRAIMTAAQLYEADNGKLPNDSNVGQFPSDFESYIAAEVFTKTSPSGGQYDWNGPPAHSGTSAGLQLVIPDASTQPFYTQIELLHDDSNKSTGRIRANSQRVIFDY
ncbi:MAG: hypothetical protein Aurels2KO_56350 [Aureliella sp.]